MVARISRLRIALLLSPLKRAVRESIATLLLRLLLLAGAVGVAWLPLMISRGDESLLHQVDVVVAGIAFLVLVFIYFFAPSLVLDPRSFQAFPITPTKIALLLGATSPLTWLGVGTIVWAVAYAVFRQALIAWTPLGILALVLAVISTLLATRLVALLSMALFANERLTRMRGSLGILVTVATLPVIGLLILPAVQTEGQDEMHEAFSLLKWLPLGGGVDALYVAGIELEAAAAIILIIAAVIALSVGGMVSLTISLNERVPQSVESVTTNTSSGWFSYLPMTPTLSIGARSLTYWVRDPRYRVSLAAIPIIPVIVVGVLWFVGVDSHVLALIPLPLMLIMLGWLVHNDIATDSTAVWMHIASGIPGRQDRFGRLIPVLVVGLPLLILGTSITVTILGDWRPFPVVLSIGMVALCGSSALSSIVSVIHPYPTSRPGESPFIQPAWQGVGSGLVQTVTFIGSVLLLIPVVWVGFVDGFNITAHHGIVTLLTSVCYAALLLIAGVLIGGWIYDRKGSELLAFTQVFD